MELTFTPVVLRALRALRAFRALALVSSALATACTSGQSDAAVEGGTIDASRSDPCDIDAFTGAGTACSVPSSLRCFPYCDGGCSCGVTPDGPRWTCVTDFSCVSACAPIDMVEGTCSAPDSGAADAGAGDSE